jgi:hypothetical protein
MKWTKPKSNVFINYAIYGKGRRLRTNIHTNFSYMLLSLKEKGSADGEGVVDGRTRKGSKKKDNQNFVVKDVK